MRKISVNNLYYRNHKYFFIFGAKSKMEVVRIRVNDLPIIFADDVLAVDEEEYSIPEETELPNLPGLFSGILKPERPKQLFMFEEWKGLPENWDKTPTEPIKEGYVEKVNLPGVSSRTPFIEEEPKPVENPNTLKQEPLIQKLAQIDLQKLEESIIFPKSGYPLPELKTIAKKLQIPTTNVKKSGLAQRIKEKIKLKEY